MASTIGIIILILILLAAFKLTAFIFKICGKLFGLLLSIIGYIIIGGVGISLIGLAVVVVPIVLICAIFAIIRAIVKL